MGAEGEMLGGPAPRLQGSLHLARSPPGPLPCSVHSKITPNYSKSNLNMNESGRISYHCIFFIVFIVFAPQELDLEGL